jgi:hypothetical protein
MSWLPTLSIKPIGFVIRYIIKNMEEAAPITEYDRSGTVAEVKSFLDGVEEAKRCKKTDIERLRVLITNPVNNIIAADASRASMLDAPITGCLIEPLTSTARQNFLPVGATKLKAA